MYDHDLVGIGVIPLPEKVLDPDNPKAINFDARGNRVEDNVVRDSRAADLALVRRSTTRRTPVATASRAITFSTSLPPDLETLAPCDEAVAPNPPTDIGGFFSLVGAENAAARTKDRAAAPPGRPAADGERRARTAEPTSKLRKPQIDIEDIKPTEPTSRRGTTSITAKTQIHMPPNTKNSKPSE